MADQSLPHVRLGALESEISDLLDQLDYSRLSPEHEKHIAIAMVMVRDLLNLARVESAAVRRCPPEDSDPLVAVSRRNGIEPLR